MVKLHWDTEELIENWTLLPTELELVNKKVGANQLGFAILLKYFQLMARFPDSSTEIPDIVISYVASQLKFDSKLYSKNPFKHPTYQALMELGRVIKTIFLCQYLDTEAVRREVNEGLNVVERWNGVNDFIFYGQRWRVCLEPLGNSRVISIIFTSIADLFGVRQHFDDSKRIKS